MRTFIAIDLGKDIQRYLALISKELNKNLAKGDVRWVRAEKIHLTLRFLGDTESTRIGKVIQLLDGAAHLVDPFELKLGQIGCYPNEKRPRVIWIGFHSKVPELAVVQGNIEKGVVELGWQPEGRRYHPHLTLGRVKNSAAVVGAQIPWGKKVTQLPTLVNSLALYESTLKPDGPVYTLIHRSILN